MPKLTRPDGVEIHFEERGEGSPVVLALGTFSAPAAFEPLIEELASDHRVVTYDPRGTGRSTRTGPYDIETDTDDFEAVVREIGGGAVVVCTANAAHPAVKVAARWPDLVTAVVGPGGTPLGVSATAGAEGLAASSSVRDAFRELLRNDYRGALRTLTADLNSQLDEHGVRERVALQSEYVSQEAAVGRLEAWIADDAGAEGRELGDRLWILNWGENPWFTADMVDRMRELLPEAHLERVEDGPLSRPDIVAAVIRSLTRVRT
jgi:pimeloyl-ACP methyl ester carboxylesterase